MAQDASKRRLTTNAPSEGRPAQTRPQGAPTRRRNAGLAGTKINPMEKQTVPKWAALAAATMIVLAAASLSFAISMLVTSGPKTKEVEVIPEVNGCDYCRVAAVRADLHALSERQAFIKVANVVNPELTACADQVSGYVEWRMAMAISGHETSWGRTGVGRFNNLGGIQSKKAGRTFKHYATKCDGLEDVILTLRKPLYVEKAIAAVGATWCGGVPGCEPWAESVTLIYGAIDGLTGPTARTQTN